MSVLENINIHDGAGNTLTSTSSALDVNLKTSAATVTVAQPTGTNLHTVVDSGTIVATQATGSNLHTVVDSGTIVATQPTASSLNATVRNQDGAGNNLTSTSGALDSNLKTIGGTAVQTGTGTSGSGIPRVTVANDSKVQPWDGTNSAKFDATGETTTDITRFGGTAVTIGQKTMAASIPVVIASDQEIVIGAVYTTQSGTSSSGVVPTTANGTLTIMSGVWEWSTLVLNFVPQPPISFGGQFQLEGSIDNVNWTPLTGTIQASNPQQLTQYLTTNFQTVSARYNLAGFPSIRIRTLNGFTGTINVEYALTTALGDETTFSKTELIDASGASVTLPTQTQYTAGVTPAGVLYQSGSTTFNPVPDGSQWTSSPIYVLPKSPIIGDTLVVALVAFGNSGTLTAANLSGLQLVDTNNNWYTPTNTFDTTTTKFGEAVVLFAVPVTQLDSENNIGFTPVCSAVCPTSLSVFVHELQNVSVSSPLVCGHTSGASGSSLTPLASPSGNFPVTLLVTQTSGGQPIVPAYAQSQFMDTQYWGMSGSSFNAITYGTVTNDGYDLFAIAAPIVSKGTAAMGYDYVGEAMHPLSVSSTGVLNTTIVGTPTVAATQSGTWTIANPSVSSVVSGNLVPNSATLVGAGNPSGGMSALQMDGGGNLKVNIAAGTGVSNPAASTTGSTVPADASYTGVNVNGKLVGQSGISILGVNSTGVTAVAAVGIVDQNGNLIGSTLSGALDVNVRSGSTSGIQYTGGSYVTATATGTLALGLTPADATAALSLDTLGHLNTNIVNTPSVTVSGTPTVSISGTPAVTVSGTVTSKSQDGAGNNLTSTSGSLNVNVTGGSAAGTQYTAGTAAATPTGTVALGTDGTDVRALSTTSTGALNVVAAPVAITGASGASIEAAQGSAAPAHVLQVGGVYNTTSPLPGNGDITALQTDGNGSLKVSLAGSSITPLVQIQSSGTNLTNTGGALNVNVTNNPTNTNGAAAATGSTVPADASYTGFNSGGNLVGVSSTNPLPVTVVSGGGGSSGTQYTSGQLSGANTTGTVAMGGYGSGASTYAVPLSVSSTGVLTVNGSGVTQPVSGTVSANVASNGTAITNTSGALDVNIKSGAAGTQYAAGTAVATPTGTIAMGTDGTDVRALSTDTSGRLNANLYVGGSANGVLNPVTISASGNANTASNPISIAVTDGAHTSVMAATGTAPTTSTYSLPVAAVLYAGATPTAIGTPVAAGTGTLSGNALTCNSTVYAGTAPASASNLLPVSARLTDGTTAISGAVSSLGSQPLGTAVQSVNTVALTSPASGAALGAKFINASGAAVNIKTLAGNLYGFSLTNSTASPAYVEFFNTAGTPTLGTTAVVFCVVIPASGNVTINPTTLGLMNFTTGIGFAVTTAENGTTPAAVTGMIFFA